MMRYVPVNRRKSYYPMRSAFDKFFDNFLEDDKAEENVKSMAIDLLENENDYEVKANLPGFDKKDINISINKNELVIEANHEDEKEEKKDSYYRCERYSGNFKRTIALTEKCDAKSIKAGYNNGVLSITIPKTEPEPAKKIDIQ